MEGEEGLVRTCCPPARSFGRGDRGVMSRLYEGGHSHGPPRLSESVTGGYSTTTSWMCRLSSESTCARQKRTRRTSLSETAFPPSLRTNALHHRWIPCTVSYRGWPSRTAPAHVYPPRCGARGEQGPVPAQTLRVVARRHRIPVPALDESAQPLSPAGTWGTGVHAESAGVARSGKLACAKPRQVGGALRSSPLTLRACVGQALESKWRCVHGRALRVDVDARTHASQLLLPLPEMRARATPTRPLVELR